MKRWIYILILALMATACRTSKSTVQQKVKTVHDTVVKTHYHVDTVIKTRVVEKTRPVENRVVIREPCDSLGNLRQFQFQFGSGQNKGSLISKNGKLYFKLHLDSIKNSIENRYRSRYEIDSTRLRSEIVKELKKNTETVRTVWPWWLYALLVVAGVSLTANLLQRLRII